MNKFHPNLPDVLPVLPVRNSVVFPFMVVPLMIKDDKYLNLIDKCLKSNKKIVLSLILDPEKQGEDDPEVHSVGTVCYVNKLSKMEDGTVVIVQGIERIMMTDFFQHKSHLYAKIKKLKEVTSKSKESKAMVNNVLGLFKHIVELTPYLPDELVYLSRTMEKPGALADMIVSPLNIDPLKKQKILDCLDIKKRLMILTKILNEELELQKMGQKIQDRVQKKMDKSQNEYYLREQLKAIQKELGIGKEGFSEIDELHQKLESKKLPENAQKAAVKELERISVMNTSSQEYTVSRTYLDWILDLPWMEDTNDYNDISRAEKILDKHHYGLEKIKKRILEYLSVRKLNPQHKGPILCLVGPPGTGKTSLGRSIAAALGKKFTRISLGGIRDEAEIRGHRRTYVGALPGRIIQGLKKTGSNNPVFMLDEIDKIGNDFRGDPSSALLEVLDPEQNFSFSDHYLELEFDLSKIMFITTANQLETIPSPLKDRMEILELEGYTEDEKTNIASRFLVPRQILEHGLKPKNIVIQKTAIRKIIREYTREAGVRNLEREIGAVCRGVARKVAQGKDTGYVIDSKGIVELLGKPRFSNDIAQRTSVPGVATGMAWTPSGGDILFIETTMMPGQKSLTLTGQLGDIMKESAQTALSYIRSRAKQLHISEDFFKENDLHIHVPAGAIPKDGPSAGVTMLTSLASLLTSRPVKMKLAMTGEVTLRGIVLPVGGIKEKVLAANRSGIKHIILPEENRKDLDDIPDKVKKQIAFHFVKKMDEVLEIALSTSFKPPHH